VPPFRRAPFIQTFDSRCGGLISHGLAAAAGGDQTAALDAGASMSATHKISSVLNLVL
jgi:hypothetical protein